MWPPEAEFTPEYLMRCALGLIPGSRRAFNAGNFAGVTSGNVPQDIWTNGGLYPWLLSATGVKVRSSSPLDAPGGTGCQSVRAFTLDGNYAEVTQNVTLNGTTDVNLPTNLLRINFALGILPGIANAEASNVGTIEFRRQDNNQVLAVIPPDKGMTRQSHYTVPAGFTLIMCGWDMGVNAASGASTDRNADIEPMFRAPGEIWRAPRIITASDGNPTTLFLRTFAIIPEKNDFRYRCVSTSASSATAVTGAWEGILIPKTTP